MGHEIPPGQGQTQQTQHQEVTPPMGWFQVFGLDHYLFFESEIGDPVWRNMLDLLTDYSAKFDELLVDLHNINSAVT